MSGNSWSPPPNSTWPDSSLNSTWSPNNGEARQLCGNHTSTWSNAFRPEISYIIATSYLSFLCIIAVIMCLKHRTRLRAYACFITYLGLTIAVIGLLRAKFLISPSWFWAWNFFGEGFGVVLLALTIVSVGSGFYPMARNRHLSWYSSVSVIVIYGIVAVATLACYVYTKLLFRPLTGDEVQSLRNDIISKGILTDKQLEHQRRWEQYRGYIPGGDGALTGVQDWRQLAWAEREMYARPSTEFYLGHQLLMLMTCMWVCIYLFIPLVVHHRNGPVGRPLDGDMMAVGVWYLTCLMTLALGYAILNIYFCIHQELIFEQQAQALDLCMRITIAPILFLPAPPFLLRFYRARFQKMKAAKNSGCNGGVNRNGSGSNHFGGSFANSAISNTNVSPDGTQVGSRLFTLGDSSVTRCSHDDKYHELTPPTEAYGRFKVYPSRHRGTSLESSRVFCKDFECESDDDSHHSECHGDSSISYGDKEKKVRRSHDLLEIEKPSASMDTLQVPEPVLTVQRLQAERKEATVDCWRDEEIMPKSPVRSRRCSVSSFNQAQGSGVEGPFHSEETGEADEEAEETDEEAEEADEEAEEADEEAEEADEEAEEADEEVEEADEGSEIITGSTGWEVGGYNSQEREDVSKSPCPSQDTEQPSGGNFDHLTGLQRQLAEYRSTLLPRVLAYQAYQEDLASVGPNEHKIKPADPFDLSVFRRSSEAEADPNMLANNGVRSSLFPDPSEKTETWDEREDTFSGLNVSGGSKSKSKEGLIAVFSKALNSSNKDKGSNTKDGGQASQDGASEMKSASIAPTVEELAQLSTSESSNCKTNYEYDLYDDQPGFKRFRDSPHQVAGYCNGYTPTGLDAIDDSVPESKGSNASKRASIPSLVSSKSRDNLSKNGTISKDSQGRPTSPSSKKPTSRASRISRSKSDASYGESIESPKPLTVELPLNISAVAVAADEFEFPALMDLTPTMESPDIPPLMVKTSLSPPPRQNWRSTSKSFKNVQPRIVPIDTTVVMDHGEPSSSAATSPTSQPLIFASTRFHDDPHVNRERERLVQMSPRPSGSRRQRSIDNLASAYYYRRASELTANSNSQPARHTREPSGIAALPSIHSSYSTRPSNQGSPPSPSIRAPHSVSAFSYAFTMQDPNGRGSPSPTFLYSNNSGNGSSHHPLGGAFGGGDSSLGESHSRAASLSSNRILSDDYWTQTTMDRSHPKTFADDYWTQAMIDRAQSKILADDSWTQAMIDRAQSKKPSLTLPSLTLPPPPTLLSLTLPPPTHQSDLSEDLDLDPLYHNRRPSVGRALSE